MSGRGASTTVRSVAVVPSSLALLPELASPDDPLREAREHALAAAAWLWRRHGDDVAVLAAPQREDNVARGVEESPGLRIGRALLAAGAAAASDPAATDAAAGASALTAATGAPALAPGEAPTAAGLLVVANGSATRSEKAPGHLDQRAFAFDDALAGALRSGRPEQLTALDAGLAEQLWCFDAPAWCHLGRLAPEPDGPVCVDYDDDPFGVRYWVVRWTCAS